MLKDLQFVKWMEAEKVLFLQQACCRTNGIHVPDAEPGTDLFMMLKICDEFSQSSTFAAIHVC